MRAVVQLTDVFLDTPPHEATSRISQTFVGVNPSRRKRSNSPVSPGLSIEQGRSLRSPFGTLTGHQTRKTPNRCLFIGTPPEPISSPSILYKMTDLPDISDRHTSLRPASAPPGRWAASARVVSDSEPSLRGYARNCRADRPLQGACQSRVKLAQRPAVRGNPTACSTPAVAGDLLRT